MTAPNPEPQPGATTRRGLAVLGWLALFGLLLTSVADYAGLKYVQGVIWPTDLHAWSLRAPHEPAPTVAILGSSRASFGLTPSVMSACLQQATERGTLDPAQLGPGGTTTVNLARVFATGDTLARIYRDLLSDKPPTVLLVAIAPEALDDTNPMLPESIAATTGVADLPGALASSRTLPEATAALRPFARGAETLALFLAGRHIEEARLRWLMAHHGGGQWCSGSPACEAQNNDLMRILAGRFDHATQAIVPTIRTERFGEYVPDHGRVYTAVDQLLAQATAQGVQVGIVKLPLHESFSREIPPEAHAAFTQTLQALALRHQATVLDGHSPALARSRRAWVDPDHLAPNTAQDLTERVCTELVVPLLRDGPR